MAIACTVLFLAGLHPVTIVGGQPHYPGPWEPAETMTAFFQARPMAVRLCAFLQFGAAIPLGIFTATIVSRLQFLGSRAAGVSIALFGGITTSMMIMAASIALWVMAQPGIADNSPMLQVPGALPVVPLTRFPGLSGSLPSAWRSPVRLRGPDLPASRGEGEI
jgi:hypothetical protein